MPRDASWWSKPLKELKLPRFNRGETAINLRSLGSKIDATGRFYGKSTNGTVLRYFLR